jgi:hypothetical protein
MHYTWPRGLSDLLKLIIHADGAYHALVRVANVLVL